MYFLNKYFMIKSDCLVAPVFAFQCPFSAVPFTIAERVNVVLGIDILYPGPQSNWQTLPWVMIHVPKITQHNSRNLHSRLIGIYILMRYRYTLNAMLCMHSVRLAWFFRTVEHMCFINVGKLTETQIRSDEFADLKQVYWGFWTRWVTFDLEAAGRLRDGRQKHACTPCVWSTHGPSYWPNSIILNWYPSWSCLFNGLQLVEFELVFSLESTVCVFLPLVIDVLSIHHRYIFRSRP